MRKITLITISAIAGFNAIAQPTLIGMTSLGYGGCSIFSTPTGGTTVNQIYNFTQSGTHPTHTQLCQTPDGLLHGMTLTGGDGGLSIYTNFGQVFSFDLTKNCYRNGGDFLQGTTSGQNPEGSLLPIGNNEFYGMTREGGYNYKGVLFRNMTTLVHFAGASNGAHPIGSLILASNGKLYGLTETGGINDKGVLFEFDTITSILTKKIDFDGSNNGKYPSGSLIQASNGKLYGTTYYGGLNNLGVLFSYDPSTSIYTKLFDFSSTTTGSNPNGSLMEASNGKLYGMTMSGGTNGDGVIFQYDTASATFTKLFDFTGTSTGAMPKGSLIQATNGKFYGLTSMGGANNDGVLFEYDVTTSNFINEVDFTFTSKGSNPSGTLMQAANGNLYGMTQNGGANGEGLLFEYTISNSLYKIKYYFTGHNEGKVPLGTLLHATNGKFYGMTERGGANLNTGGVNSLGTLFEYDVTTNLLIRKRDFALDSNGCSPTGNLIQATNGLMYGMTPEGGTYGHGVLFEYDPVTNIYTKKIDFGDTLHGIDPQGSLLQATNGKLYGMANGGLNGKGVIFEYVPSSGIFTKVYDFLGGLDGGVGRGSLIQALNGKLYGLGSLGQNGVGVLFEYDITNSVYVNLHNFFIVDGKYPYGSLIQASDGNLYGMTWEGGFGNLGVIFKYDISSSIYTDLYDFGSAGSTMGRQPYGNSIMQASNGKLYAMVTNSGFSNYDVLFEYELSSSTYTVKLTLDQSVCGYGPQGDLIEYGVPTNIGIKETFFDNSILIFPNPFTSQTTITFNEPQKNTAIKIIDVIGKEIKTICFSGKECVIEKGEMKAGVYFVEITSTGSVTGSSPNEVVRKKLVVQ